MKQRDITKTPKVYQSSPPLATLSLPICHPSYRHQREQSRMTNCSEKSWKVFKYFNHPSGKKLCSIIAHCSTNNQHGSHFVFSQILIYKTQHIWIQTFVYILTEFEINKTLFSSGQVFWETNILKRFLLVKIMFQLMYSEFYYF